jgi:hypothetical protein
MARLAERGMWPPFQVINLNEIKTLVDWDGTRVDRFLYISGKDRSFFSGLTIINDKYLVDSFFIRTFALSNNI